MRKLTWLALAGALALALAAAGPAAAQLAGSEWRPAEIGGVAVPDGSEHFVRFGGDGELAGNGGCNRFTGSYTITGDAIEFGPVGATQMACPDPLMEGEARFLKALLGAKRFARDRTELSLSDEAGNPVMLLIQTDAD